MTTLAVVSLGIGPNRAVAAFLQPDNATLWINEHYPNAIVSPGGTVRACDAHGNFRIVGDVKAVALMDMPGELIDQRPYTIEQ